MKKILFALILLIVMSGLGNAGTWVFHGTAGHTECGNTQNDGKYGGSVGSLNLTSGSTYYITRSLVATFDNDGCAYCNYTCGAGRSGSELYIDYGACRVCGSTKGGKSYESVEWTPSSDIEQNMVIWYGLWGSSATSCPCSGNGVIIYSNDTVHYTVSGNAECITSTDLYIYSDGSYHYIKRNTDESYTFEVYNDTTYKLIFSDAHEYIFTVNQSNINYDHDDCSHTQYRFEELCGNLIPDSEGFYSEYIGTWGLPTFFHSSSGTLDISNSSASKIQIYTTPFSGIAGWVIDPVVTDTEYTLTNPNINWGLKVIVQNESDDTLINGAIVKVDQSCYCTSETSTRQKMTVSGMAGFIDMSLQDASLLVMKDGYKPINENSTGYSVFLSGRANFSSKTWICKLAPSWSNNSSSFYEVNNAVGIHFVNESGNRTSKIVDTDSEVYLYYENNNTNEEAMTLKFQSSSTHTYFIDEQSWTIAYDDIGHKTIANSYFTPWDYSYRAVIYNSSIYGWNMTIPLTVRNATKEEEAHYQNLSSCLFFMYAHDGKIDHRDTMKIGIHACSNNITLMTTDIELWKDGAYLCCKNLTATDYLTSDFPYYYIWSPIYEYVSGSNYSIRMYGFDRTLLETDYVECINDSTTRKNKLTIGVKDRSGTNLNNCYIYLEDWGSLSTGSTYYNAYEGIDNGDYRYKASKSGYTSSGWIDVTISDGDKIVWYTLTDDTASGAPVAAKMTNNDIKGFFFPIMFLLFICILLGGLKYVS